MSILRGNLWLLAGCLSSKQLSQLVIQVASTELGTSVRVLGGCGASLIFVVDGVEVFVWLGVCVEWSSKMTNKGCILHVVFGSSSFGSLLAWIHYTRESAIACLILAVHRLLMLSLLKASHVLKQINHRVPSLGFVMSTLPVNAKVVKLAEAFSLTIFHRGRNQSFNNFILLDKIVFGGSGGVWRARESGPETMTV